MNGINNLGDAKLRNSTKRAPETLSESSSEQPLYSPLPNLYEASIKELQNGLEQEHFTSTHLVKAYLARIEEVNHKGPKLRAVIEINLKALSQAAAADDERKNKPTYELGSLHGIPILVKDNIATVHEEGMNTTAGSFALLGSVVPRDATVAAHLRTAGAIILGKTNLSEWANFRGVVPNGFSARGGQGTSPYYPLLDPMGSSSGSAVAAAIGLAAATLGSETNGSIVSPSSRNNIVGIKPTVGLTSRAGVIPISSHQDSVGPMTRSVEDAATILSVIAGRDPLDPATWNQPQPVPDYRKALNMDALRGVRLGVPRKFRTYDKHINVAFNEAINVIRKHGAIVIDPAEFPNMDEIFASENETVVLSTDFKVDINNYLAGLTEVPTGVKTLADLIAFNTAHADKELIPPFYADQSQFIASDVTTVDDKYLAAVAANEDLGRARGIDATLNEYNLDAILLPTDGVLASTPPAIAGYPMITVPLGFQPDDVIPTAADPIIREAPGTPFGISFIGTAYSEFNLISYAFAYEQATQTRLERLAYDEAIPATQLRDVIASG